MQPQKRLPSYAKSAANPSEMWSAGSIVAFIALALSIIALVPIVLVITDVIEVGEHGHSGSHDHHELKALSATVASLAERVGVQEQAAADATSQLFTLAQNAGVQL